MVFKTIYEAREWFRNYKPLDYDTFQSIEMYFAKGVNFGDWVLFQHIQKKDYDKDAKHYNYNISRPILGINTGYDVWDMAFVFKIIEQPRAWMNSHSVITNTAIDYSMPLILNNEPQDFPIWDDYIYELEHWKTRPTISQLKEALKKKL